MAQESATNKTLEEVLKILRSNHSITSLILQDNSVVDKATGSLGVMVFDTQLILGRNEINAEDFKAIFGALGNNITCIVLTKNTINDEVADSICSALSESNVVKLRYRGNNISGEKLGNMEAAVQANCSGINDEVETLGCAGDHFET